jgi:CDP-glucose 4,6-dehydratase
MDSRWRGRRVLVTGHTGFKGGWLSVWLKVLGARVWGLALDPPTTPSLCETAGVESGLGSIRADINDFPATLDSMRRSEPEVVFHLAAQPLVRLSYAQPLVTFSTNVLGTAHVLEAVRQVGSARAVVVVTSDKCYENREWPWGYRENEPMGGYDPYSSSKGCAELLSAAYRRSFLAPAGIHMATARSGNVHGGGDWATDRLVPDLVRAFMAGDNAFIRSPGAVRPWQHVLEPMQGYLVVAERLLSDGASFAEAWNFGPDVDAERPVAHVADTLARHWGQGARWTHERETGAPHEATFLKLDSSKARQRLGWKPRWGLNEGLERTVQWYRAYFEGRDVRELMESQIADYVAADEAEAAVPGRGAGS